jgi:predicted transcriptional regulator
MVMKLRSDTIQTIEFIKAMRTERFKDMSVSDVCYYAQLNEDMVGRNLTKLKKAGLISRDRVGAGSKYIYPQEIDMGRVILTLQEVFLYNRQTQDLVMSALNQIKL